MENEIRFTKNELLERVSSKLADKLYSGMEGNELAGSPGEAGDGRRRRKKKRQSHTKPRDVTDQQILDLIRSQGPLRVVEIIEITGLTQSAAHKKVAGLRESGAIKEVREGTTVRYMVSRGAASARKSARKVSSKRSKASAASKTNGKETNGKAANGKAANGKAANGKAAAGKEPKRPRGRPFTKKAPAAAATPAASA